MGKRIKQTLQDALNEFQKIIKLNAQFDMKVLAGADASDAVLHIDYDNRRYDLSVTVKPTINRAVIGIVAQKRINQPWKVLLVTEYVNPQLAEVLRDMDLMFLDTAGNAYFNEPPLYIFIKGNKLKEKLIPQPLQRAFKPTGLQVIFALLCKPHIEDKPFREIAKDAGVALGTVGLVMRDLKNLGYLVDMGKRGRRLVKKENLLKRWATEYPEQIRPKYLKGHFSAKQHGWWKETEIREYNAYWGGEVAAAVLTDYLKPEKITIYMDGPIGKLAIRNGFEKDPNGNIGIYGKFWNFEFDWEHRNLVHPVLIYTDLTATADNRNVETANMIYENELIRYLRED